MMISPWWIVDALPLQPTTTTTTTTVTILYYAQWTCLALYFRLTTDSSGTNRDCWNSELLLPLILLFSMVYLWRVVPPEQNTTDDNDWASLFVTLTTDAITPGTMDDHTCCAICMEQCSSLLNSPSTIWKTKQCPHVFHKVCVLSWCHHQLNHYHASQIDDNDAIRNDRQRNTGAQQPEPRVVAVTCPCCRTPLNPKDGVNTIQTQVASPWTALFGRQTWQPLLPVAYEIMWFSFWVGTALGIARVSLWIYQRRDFTVPVEFGTNLLELRFPATRRPA